MDSYQKNPEAAVVTTRSRPQRNVTGNTAATNLAQIARAYGLRLESELSARGQALKALQESERRYREFFDNAKDAFYIHDLNGRYTLVNQAGEQLVGYTTDEILRMSIFDIVAEDQISCIRENMRKKMADHAPTMYEVEIIRKDGRKLPVEVNSRLIFAHGVPVGVQGTARDISDRRRAEDELRASELRFRTLAQTASDAILLIDKDSRIRLANPAVEKIFGHQPEELMGKSLSVLLAVRSRSAHYSAFNKYFGEGRKNLSWSAVELPGLHRGGRELPLELSFAEFTKEGERFFTVIARDITERKQGQAGVRASEERFRDLVENANDIIFSCDMSGNITSLNRAGRKLTGYSSVEALKMNFAETVVPEHIEKAKQMFSRKTVADVAAVYELEIVTKAGDRAALEVSSRAISSEGKPVGIQGVARDITERKRVEEALRTREVQVQQSQRLEAVGQLAGGVAHDFNNLLTVIIGYSELSLRRLGAEDPIARNIEEIKRTAERAASLTRQLLAFSRKQILEPKVLDLNNEVRDMHKMLRRLIGEDINLVTLLGSDLGRVKADPGQIHQIIMNLVVNARDAMPGGGRVTIETANVFLDDQYALEHQPVQPGEYVMMTFSDSGIGIDTETQTRIFEPFFTTKQLGKGTGLGLSTVYGIVKQSGGYVWVYSEVGTGTTFKVYLPRVDELPDEEVTRRFPKRVPKGSETVLLVEDEVQVLQIAREMLESQGYCVLPAANGEEALALASERTEKIHLLITDVIMPQMGGRELVERVALLRPEMKVLYMTGYTDDATVHLGLLEERVEIIQKPFTADSLALKVRKTLGY